MSYSVCMVIKVEFLRVAHLGTEPRKSDRNAWVKIDRGILQQSCALEV